jgi:sugar phosphate isomerase/epimerase
MKNISRKKFIQLSTGAVAATTLGSFFGCNTKPSPTTPIGLQLYSVRHELDDDFEGTIARLAEMGYEGVEFADYHNLTGEEIRTILDRYNLQSCGNHVLVNVFDDENFDETVELNQTIGNDIFIIRWIPENQRESKETFLQTIQTYNEISERLEQYGMRLGYHNHDYIFETFDGEYLWDILAENTDDRFIMQLDTGHAALMGMNPVELLERHPGRHASIHAKAFSTTRPEAVIGEDDLDWAAIIEASKTVGGIEWFILEYEIEGVPPLRALETSINNFREIRGA